MKKLILALLLLGIVGIVDKSEAQQTIVCGYSIVPCAASPIQGIGVNNSFTTGGAGAATTVTITGIANTKIHIYRVSAFCTANTGTLTIADAAVTKYSSPAAAVTTAEYIVAFDVGLTITAGNNAVITLSACGASTGNVNIEADQY